MPPEDLTSIDVSQLDTLAQLEADHRALQALAGKAAWRRDKEIEIYSRVLTDYEARMSAIGEQAKPVRQRVRDDLQKLDELCHRYEQALDQAKVKLQECEFRHEIGEFTAQEYQQCQQANERAIGEREAELEAVKKLRLRYRELLPSEPVLPPTPVRAAARRTGHSRAAITRVIPAPAAPPPPASVEPPLPAAPVRATAPAVEEPVSPAGANTMFLGPPSPDEFKVPARPKAAKDTNAYDTISVSSAMLIEDRDGLPGTHHRLGSSTSIGRTRDNEIVVAIKEVSRRHAEIVMADGVYVLKDLGSPNGTFVNGKRIAEQPLQEGDKVALGGKVFVFTRAS
jgi:hypothetical protein